jgi:hypothetical protein
MPAKCRRSKRQPLPYPQVSGMAYVLLVLAFDVCVEGLGFLSL